MKSKNTTKKQLDNKSRKDGDQMDPHPRTMGRGQSLPSLLYTFAAWSSAMLPQQQ